MQLAADNEIKGGWLLQMSAEGDLGDMEGLENGAGNGADMLLDDSGAGAADDAVSILRAVSALNVQNLAPKTW